MGVILAIMAVLMLGLIVVIMAMAMVIIDDPSLLMQARSQSLLYIRVMHQRIERRHRDRDQRQQGDDQNAKTAGGFNAGHNSRHTDLVEE